jgi:acetoacetyl-CoA synthetase
MSENARKPRQTSEPVAPIWQPGPDGVDRPRITEFADFATRRTGVARPDYQSLHAWSTQDLAGFWAAVVEFFDIRTTGGWEHVLDDAPMPATRWFAGARLNYAEHALRSGESDATAVISVSQDGLTSETTWGQLRAEVGALAGWLREHDVSTGDRVVGYLPNIRQAVVAFLACASVGAIWSACAQDYSASGAAARFAQLEPVVLFAADGYVWGGRTHDRRAEVEELRNALPTLRATVHVPNLGLPPQSPGIVTWQQATSEPAEPTYAQLPFDAPLWVLFSSGTTGAPKGIVHGHGGVLLDHHKLLGLHFDLGPGDRFLWYTTTNWMMWNMLVSGLLLGSTIVLYDGSPTHPGPDRLWRLAAEHMAAVLGVSPGYLQISANAGVEPADLGLPALRILGSTGAPLPAEPYHWVRDHVGDRVQVASTSGGTDVVSGFAGSAPTVPVWAGEISAPMLGVALDAYDAQGRSVTDEVGELVITRPMPSMPVCFWNDPDGSRYREAYFEVYPGVWRHGDWGTRTRRGGVIVSGRSDATLNRQGVRLGSADIYAVVENLPGIRESLVVGAEFPDGGYWMPLFVVLEPAQTLTDEFRESVTDAIRTQASPRHVPDEVIAVPALPHTRTGKKMEVPVKRLLQGAALEQVVDREAVDDFEALEYFTRFAPAGS